jgi:plastocyanin
VNARVLTPTLIICCAGAIAGGIALARPATTPAAATAAAGDTGAPATTPAAPAAGSGYGRKPTATTAARGSAAPKAQAPSAPAALTISGFAFGAPLTVAPGTKVSVRNNDSAPHTVTGSAFDTGNVGGGASGTFTAPTAAGTFRFSCQIHPSMTGSLTVR